MEYHNLLPLGPFVTEQESYDNLIDHNHQVLQTLLDNPGPSEEIDAVHQENMSTLDEVDQFRDTLKNYSLRDSIIETLIGIIHLNI